MRGGEFTNPIDIKSLVALGLDRRPGPGAVVPPYRSSGKISMHLLLELEHCDFNGLVRLARGTDYRRDGEVIDVASKFDAATYWSWRGHRLPKSWQSFTERNSGRRIETLLEKAASAQHCSKPELTLIEVGEVFIRSISMRFRPRSFKVRVARFYYDGVKGIF